MSVCPVVSETHCVLGVTHPLWLLQSFCLLKTLQCVFGSKPNQTEPSSWFMGSESGRCESYLSCSLLSSVLLAPGLSSHDILIHLPTAEPQDLCACCVPFWDSLSSAFCVACFYATPPLGHNQTAIPLRMERTLPFSPHSLHQSLHCPLWSCLLQVLLCYLCRG